MTLEDFLVQNMIDHGGMPGQQAFGSPSFGNAQSFAAPAVPDFNTPSFDVPGLDNMSNTDIFGGLGTAMSVFGVPGGLSLSALGVALDQNSNAIAGHPSFGLADTSFSSGLLSAVTNGLFGSSIADQALEQGYGALAQDLNSYGNLTTPDLASGIGGTGGSAGLGGFGGIDGFGIDGLGIDTGAMGDDSGVPN